MITKSLQKLQTFAASFSRYASAVRSATVSVETVPGAGARGAAELNDYAEQVEDFEEQLFERRQWMSDVTHDFATAVAQRQGEQINRLTLVSLIFLPVTALTGFFGMNFDWMTRAIASPQAFVALGVALPLLSVALSIAFLCLARFTVEELPDPDRPLDLIGHMAVGFLRPQFGVVASRTQPPANLADITSQKRRTSIVR